jgi:dipeptidyl-peptidase-4
VAPVTDPRVLADAESFPRQSARTRRFTLGQPRSLSITADGNRVLFLRALSGSDALTALWCLNIETGVEQLVVDPRAIGADGDLPAAERARRERARETAAGVVAYSSDSAATTAVLAIGGELFAADLSSSDSGTPAIRAIATGGAVFDPRVDPTGQRVAYVRERDLCVVDLATGEDRIVVAEADPDVSWGRAEHVAGEEMDRSRGFWWSPDGQRLLAARVDESAVTRWWIADAADPGREPAELRYPKAGTANADVSLHAISLDGSKVAIEWDRSQFCYLARVEWTTGHDPLLQVQSRDQRRAQVLVADPAAGTTEVLYDDGDPIWVEAFDGVPAWCGQDVVRIVDGVDARRLHVGDAAVTPNGLTVRAVAATTDDSVTFTGYEDDPTQVHVFRWSAAGIERLSDAPGVHGAVSAAGVTVIVSSSLTHAGQRHVVHKQGRRIELTSVAEQAALVPAPRLLQLGERRLCAGLVLPSDHVAGTKLPVLVDPYGGPHAQRVMSARASWLEPQWLADQGFAVLVVDGRGTPGRGPAWEREVHLDLALTLDDQVDALHAAGSIEPDLDLARVAIRGWSFGGFLAGLAVLRRPDVFHAAIAGAPVTDWTLYDTHYTERYLGDPAVNADAYARSSLLDDAPSLSRPLLIIHGLADDNVVAANSIRLSQRLTEAGRPHEFLPLTGVTHMTPQETVAENLLLLQVAFLRRALGLAGG